MYNVWLRETVTLYNMSFWLGYDHISVILVGICSYLCHFGWDMFKSLSCRSEYVHMFISLSHGRDMLICSYLCHSGRNNSHIQFLSQPIPLDVSTCVNPWGGFTFYPLTLYPLDYSIWNFHPLEVVSRWRDPQLQVTHRHHCCIIRRKWINRSSLSLCHTVEICSSVCHSGRNIFHIQFLSQPLPLDFSTCVNPWGGFTL